MMEDTKDCKRIELKMPLLVSSVKESYKTLRTNLLYTKATKTIAITSTLPNEGKSITAYHLAVSFAKAGKKTLLVDGDLRKSRLCSYLQVEKDLPGLSEYLSEQKGELMYGTSIPGLYLILSGKRPPDPSELLSKDRFAMLLAEVKERFDYVIIDTPPVSGAADASIIGRYADGIVYVVRSDFVKRKLVEKGKKLLIRNGGHIVGVVLNRMDQHQKGYYGYEEEKKVIG